MPGQRARSRRRGQVLDAVLAAGVFALLLMTLLAEGRRGSGLGLTSLLLGAAASIPLAWRRRAPLAAWAVSGGAVLAVMTLYHRSAGVLVVGPLIALYTVATSSPRRRSLAAGVVTLAAATAAVAADIERLNWESFVFPGAVIVGCWLTGDNLRMRRAYVAELEAKAARAEADRAAETARAAAQERARIARELHDSVIHHVSVIAVQAGAARMLADQAAGAADERQAWTAVEATSRQALAEMRQLLGVLRSDEDPLLLSPQPGLCQLDRLLEDVRQAGLPVDSQVQGTPVPLPPAIDLAAYRIVQEALTNILRHQGRVPATVVVGYRAEDLQIRVAGVGTLLPQPHAAPGTGHGLAGMRERVAMLGGELDAGPDPAGGFVVAAKIPLQRR
jgi:signal transduction histidine kinase